jgi:hypothetical protein
MLAAISAASAVLTFRMTKTWEQRACGEASELSELSEAIEASER